MTEEQKTIKRAQAAARTRAWYRANKLRALAQTRKWALENPERRKEIKRNSLKKRYHENPRLRVLMCLRSRLFMALNGVTKTARTAELLGCSVDQLRAHLETEFRPGMTWENYGPVWHVDHKRPCVSFNLIDPAQQRECFHYTNLQPLFAEENRKKGGRYQ